MQFTVFVSAFISLAGFAIATPPACIINAIGVQGSDAADMQVLCDTKQEYVLGNMTDSCSSSSLDAAYEYYSSTCLEEAQITVSALPSGSTGGSSGSGSSSNSDAESDSSSESDDKENAATPAVGGTPSLLFAVSGLLATGMTGVLFL